MLAGINISMALAEPPQIPSGLSFTDCHYGKERAANEFFRARSFVVLSRGRRLIISDLIQLNWGTHIALSTVVHKPLCLICSFHQEENPIKFWDSGLVTISLCNRHKQKE